MYVPDAAVVQQPGGKVVWVKEKGPEHVVFQYFIYCWLGDAFTNHKELFDRILACSYELGSLAIICRSYASKRSEIQKFHDLYLTGYKTIPLEEWNHHHELLEEAVVDIESFFWFANRLLTHVALTLNYFFKKANPAIKITKGVKSHSTLIRSSIFSFLPPNLQKAAKQLETDISDFRNTKIEHSMVLAADNSVLQPHRIIQDYLMEDVPVSGRSNDMGRLSP
jgi:hypothetical protein